jgi:hypothetical protein
MADVDRINLKRSVAKAPSARSKKIMIVAIAIIVLLLVNIAAIAWYVMADYPRFSESKATITCNINMSTGHNTSHYYLHIHGDAFPGGGLEYDGDLNASQNAIIVVIYTWFGTSDQTIEMEAWSLTPGSHSYSIRTELHPDGIYVQEFDL